MNIINRYIKLSLAVSNASGQIAEEKALNAFWAFADKYLFSGMVSISEVRQADRENNLQFVAFD